MSLTIFLLSLHFLTSYLNKTIWFTQKLPLLNPSCSSSIIFFFLSVRILIKSLPYTFLVYWVHWWVYLPSHCMPEWYMLPSFPLAQHLSSYIYWVYSTIILLTSRHHISSIPLLHHSVLEASSFLFFKVPITSNTSTSFQLIFSLTLSLPLY